MKTLFQLLLCLLSSLAWLAVPYAYAAGGGIDMTYKYAWSEQAGWLNFNTADGTVLVSDTAMTGSVWSETTGWINLNPSSTTYVHNDGSGNLSGYAWGAGIGFIDFNGVTIDADGFFHGYATSQTAGRISFNCTNTDTCSSSNFRVKTFWRPPAAAATGSGSGGGGGVSPIVLQTFGSTASSTSNFDVGSTTVLSRVNAPAMSAYASASSTALFSMPNTKCPYFTKQLRLGMRHTQVRLMQSFLMHYGFMASSTPTGYFGPMTAQAVKRFQATYAETILTPWGETKPSGWWFITTRKQANMLVDCPTTGLLMVQAPGAAVQIRAKPAISATVIAKVLTGAQLAYYDKSNGWYFVDCQSGKSGWVQASYVRVVQKSLLEQ